MHLPSHHRRDLVAYDIASGAIADIILVYTQALQTYFLLIWQTICLKYRVDESEIIKEILYIELGTFNIL